MKKKLILFLTTLTGIISFIPVLSAQTNNPDYPDQKPVLVLVNQVGYNLEGEKIFVLQIRDTLKKEPDPDFRIMDVSGRLVFTGKLNYQGRVNERTDNDWGARYWSGNFSRLDTIGEYQVRLKIGTKEYYSYQFQIGHNIIFKKTILPAVHFFWYQRCGTAVPGLHLACHMDDAKIPGIKGGHINATGGWHNAGDFNKYADVSCRSVYSLIVLARNARKLGLNDSAYNKILDEGLWGAKFLYKMWQPGKGLIYQEVWNGYDYFGRPDLETDNIVGTDDDRPIRGSAPSSMTACALAAAARETGNETYRKAAENLWKTAVDSLPFDREEPWLKTSGGVPALSQDVTGRLIRRTADLLLADLELEALTQKPRYMKNAQSCAESLLKLQKENGLWPTDIYTKLCYQGIPPAALALYLKSHRNTSIANDILKALNLWVSRIDYLTSNPFNLIPWGKGIFFDPYLKNWGYYVGQNSQYLSNSWALYLIAPLLEDSNATTIASRQIDWILGSNPYGLCMMEGTGSFNSPFYLHRWAPDEARGSVPGAVVNGFTRVESGDTIDKPYFDLYRTPRRVSYHTSEPWEPHNAFFILAVSESVNALAKNKSK
ncbi:MAG: glycoside hydrolase family 9 protein [Peptostreptococcaceae bacterium]|nr:glycoside hydrolase family 9 protein [Peptostreptococcaceae bacterium]